MPEQFLRILGHVPHPEVVLIIGLVFAAVVLTLMLRARHAIAGSILAVCILALGFAPYASAHALRSRGVYHVQVMLVRADQSPVYYAQLKSSYTGEMKVFEGGWRLDIPAQTRPTDGKVSFAASVKDEFLKGSTTLTLGDDYYPVVTIPLEADTSAKIRGVVVDDKMAAVEGATVSVDGFPDVAITDKKGSFTLSAHAGNGQMVEIRAQKDGAFGHVTAPAGKTAEIIME